LNFKERKQVKDEWDDDWFFLNYKQSMIELFHIHDVMEDHLITNEVLAKEIERVKNTNSQVKGMKKAAD
jgi:hypothetical protein